DWSKVDLEGLRAHLIDMNDVVLHSEVVQRTVGGGVAVGVAGGGHTTKAIRNMLLAHAHELDHLPRWSASAPESAGGARLSVTARDQSDSLMVAWIRGLGFIGLLATGAHHQVHHLAMARGTPSEAHQH